MRRGQEAPRGVVGFKVGERHSPGSEREDNEGHKGNNAVGQMGRGEALCEAVGAKQQVRQGAEGRAEQRLVLPRWEKALAA